MSVSCHFQDGIQHHELRVHGMTTRDRGLRAALMHGALADRDLASPEVSSAILELGGDGGIAIAAEADPVGGECVWKHVLKGLAGTQVESIPNHPIAISC